MTREKNLEAMLTITAGFLLLYVVFKTPAFLIISLVIAAIGLFSKSLTALIARLWYKLAELLSAVVPRILLGLLYYLLLFPLAVLSRLFSKDPMHLSKDHDSLYVVRNTSFSKKDFEKTW
jgi:hypothetical protein